MSPNWWRNLLRKAGRICVQDYGRWHSAQAEAQVPEDVRGTSSAPPAASTAVQASSPVALVLPFRCDACGRFFALHKHLGSHRARAHGTKCLARFYAPCPWCLVCHRYFHTVKRVQSHLKQSPECLRLVVHLCPPMTLSELDAAESEDRAALLSPRWLEPPSWRPSSARRPWRSPSPNVRTAVLHRSRHLAGAFPYFLSPCAGCRSR